MGFSTDKKPPESEIKRPRVVSSTLAPKLLHDTPPARDQPAATPDLNRLPRSPNTVLTSPLHQKLSSIIADERQPLRLLLGDSQARGTLLCPIYLRNRCRLQRSKTTEGQNTRWSPADRLASHTRLAGVGHFQRQPGAEPACQTPRTQPRPPWSTPPAPLSGDIRERATHAATKMLRLVPSSRPDSDSWPIPLPARRQIERLILGHGFLTCRVEITGRAPPIVVP